MPPLPLVLSKCYTKSCWLLKALQSQQNTQTDVLGSPVLIFITALCKYCGTLSVTPVPKNMTLFSVTRRCVWAQLASAEETDIFAIKHAATPHLTRWLIVYLWIASLIAITTSHCSFIRRSWYTLKHLLVTVNVKTVHLCLPEIKSEGVPLSNGKISPRLIKSSTNALLPLELKWWTEINWLLRSVLHFIPPPGFDA